MKTSLLFKHLLIFALISKVAWAGDITSESSVENLEAPKDLASETVHDEVIDTEVKKDVNDGISVFSKEETSAAPTEEKIAVEALKKEEPPKEKEKEKEKTADEKVLTNAAELDELQSLKEDVGEDLAKKSPEVVDKVEPAPEKKSFDENQVEDEAKILVDLSKKVKGRINTRDWNELLVKNKIEKYSVRPGDTLNSISRELFGTEDYAAKIWALNPQVTNPNSLTPGVVLAFDSGDDNTLPNIKVGEFAEDDAVKGKKGSSYSGGEDKYLSPWIKERRKLIEQGVYFQFASEETFEDLERLEKQQKNNEWEKYDPPFSDLLIREPGDDYDSSGFDKNTKIVFDYKQGFFLNSFVSTNVIQDLGEITAAKNEPIFIHKNDTVYVKFDANVRVRPGDIYSIYVHGGEIRGKSSDRAGMLYTISGQVRVIRSKGDVWECLVYEQSGIIQRKDRLTIYTPKIGKMERTFSKRKIEATIVGSYRDSSAGLSYGDVVYLDRGRADGVELGNIFDLYSFIDRGTDKKISSLPTYKIGELNVISLSDNFSTALITMSSSELQIGQLATTRTQEEAARMLKNKNKLKSGDLNSTNAKALGELDVELNIDDVGQDILNKADKVRLTEDEIEELDRQEKDKSVIKESDRDVKELDRLESEISDASKSLNEKKLDEDKLLEQQSLEDQERKTKTPDQNAFESINEIEKDIGKKYLDENINSKENPYGLTEFDLEEIDELLNTGHKK